MDSSENLRDISKRVESLSFVTLLSLRENFQNPKIKEDSIQGVEMELYQCDHKYLEEQLGRPLTKSDASIAKSQINFKLKK